MYSLKVGVVCGACVYSFSNTRLAPGGVGGAPVFLIEVGDQVVGALGVSSRKYTTRSISANHTLVQVCFI